MNDDAKETSREEASFSQQIGKQVARKLKTQREATRSVWFGLGMAGLIGWSVTIPTLLGAALGIWLDKKYPSPLSWALMLLLVGLTVGCFNAWHWVDSEYKEIQQEPDE